MNLNNVLIYKSFSNLIPHIARYYKLPSCTICHNLRQRECARSRKLKKQHDLISDSPTFIFTIFMIRVTRFFLKTRARVCYILFTTIILKKNQTRSYTTFQFSLRTQNLKNKMENLPPCGRPTIQHFRASFLSSSAVSWSCSPGTFVLAAVSPGCSARRVH